MDLKTAFHSDSYHLEDLISVVPDLRPYFAKGSAFALSQNPLRTESLAPYQSYCDRTKRFIDSLHAVEDSAVRLLFDNEWYSLYKMILCDEYLYAYTHDDNDKISFSTYFNNLDIQKIFSVEDAKNFILYKSLIRDDNIIDHSRVSMPARVLYYADRLNNAQQIILSIQNLTFIPENTRAILQSMLNSFDRIHRHCNIPQIDIEDTIRDHIANFLDMPVADPKISFIGHPAQPKKSP